MKHMESICFEILQKNKKWHLHHNHSISCFMCTIVMSCQTAWLKYQTLFLLFFLQEIYNENSQAGLTLAAYLTWVVLSTVLMLNLLIAMMNQSFKESENHAVKSWYFPFAALVLNYESRLTKRRLNPDFVFGLMVFV